MPSAASDVWATTEYEDNAGVKHDLHVPRKSLTAFLRTLNKDTPATTPTKTLPALERLIASVQDTHNIPHDQLAHHFLQVIITIRDYTTEIWSRLCAPWTDVNHLAIDNYDWEKDDEKLVEHDIKLVMEAEAKGQLLPTTASLAGERYGVDPQTFTAAVRTVAQYLGKPSGNSEEEGQAFWEKYNYHLIKGGDLQALPGGPPVTKKDGSAYTSGQETKAAAERLCNLIGDRKFNLSTYTSATVPLSMGETLRNCRALPMTCSLVFKDDGTISPYGGNAWFHKVAYNQLRATIGANNRERWDRAVQSGTVSDLSQSLGCAFIHVHGSALEFEHRALSDLPDWEKSVLRKVVDPITARNQIYQNHNLTHRWTCQTEASLRGIYNQDFVDLLTARINKVLQGKFRGSTPCHISDWLSDCTRVEHYTREECMDTRLTMIGTFIKNANNADNNTMGDLTAAVLKRSTPDPKIFFIPYQRGEPDKNGKITNFRISSHCPTEFIAVGADEEEFFAEYAQTAAFFDDLASRSESTEGANERHLVINEEVGASFGVFADLMRESCSEILAAARNKDDDDIDKVVDVATKTKEAVESGFFARQVGKL